MTILRKSRLARSAVLAVAFLTNAGTVMAACYSGNEGALYGYNYIYATGVSATFDFIGPTDTVLSGRAIVHPMQVLSKTSSDFIGWGVAQGVGVADCPDDYVGWNVYIDGTRFGNYFCRQQFGQLSETATGQIFKLSYGSCDGVDRWRAYLNGVREGCQIIDGTQGNFESVGSESIGTTATQDLRIKYSALEFRTPDAQWVSWGLNWSICEDPGYVLTRLSNTSVRVDLQ